MALTKEDLQAIGALMDSKLEPVRADIAVLKQSQRRLQDHVSALASDVSHLNHNIEPKFDKVLEMVTGANARNRQLNLVADKVEDHEHRLFALEEVLRKA